MTRPEMRPALNKQPLIEHWDMAMLAAAGITSCARHLDLSAIKASANFQQFSAILSKLSWAICSGVMS